MITIDGEQYLTAEEAARTLGVKPATFYSYVSRGRIPSYRQGMKRRRLYRKADIDALLEIRPPANGDAAGQVPDARDWIPYTN